MKCCSILRSAKFFCPRVDTSVARRVYVYADMNWYKLTWLLRNFLGLLAGSCCLMTVSLWQMVWIFVTSCSSSLSDWGDGSGVGSDVSIASAYSSRGIRRALAVGTLLLPTEKRCADRRDNEGLVAAPGNMCCRMAEWNAIGWLSDLTRASVNDSTLEPPCDRRGGGGWLPPLLLAPEPMWASMSSENDCEGEGVDLALILRRVPDMEKTPSSRRSS